MEVEVGFLLHLENTSCTSGSVGPSDHHSALRLWLVSVFASVGSLFVG